MQVGLVISNLPFLRRALSAEVLKQLGYIVESGIVCHMFVVGLEINPNLFFHIPAREAKVAMAGFLTTFLLAFLVAPFLHVPIIPNTIFYLALSLILSGTASPLLTRLITDLKIAKSDIGRFVVSSGVLSDLMSILSITLGYVLFDPEQNFKLRSTSEIISITSTLIIETILAAKITPIIMNWVNRANPEGKPMKGSHLVLALASVVGIASITPFFVKFSGLLSAFMAGLFMPKEGRISKMIISQVKYFFTSIFYPIFFFWVGSESDLAKFGASHLGPWARLLFLFLITTVGKVVGSMVSGVMLGFHLPESIAIGLLLSLKGPLQVYLAIVAAKVSCYISFTSS